MPRAGLRVTNIHLVPYGAACINLRILVAN